LIVGISDTFMTEDETLGYFIALQGAVGGPG
jgi:hypothetical protein